MSGTSNMFILTSLQLCTCFKIVSSTFGFKYTAKRKNGLKIILYIHVLTYSLNHQLIDELCSSCDQAYLQCFVLYFLLEQMGSLIGVL